MIVNNLKKLNLIFYIYLIFVLFFIGASIKIGAYGDDVTYSKAVNGYGFFGYLYHPYQGWSGRSALEGIMILTINYPLFLKIYIPLSLLIISLFLCKFANPKSKINIIIICISLSLLMLINNSILAEVVWWVTGSYNYVLPFAVGLPALYIYLFRDGFSIWIKTLSIILVSISCFNEQIAIFVIIPIIVLSSIRKKDFNNYNYIFSFCVFVSTFICIFAPGNKIRFIKETGTWFPDYANMNIIDKICLGFDRLNAHISGQNLILVIFIGIIVLSVIKNNKITNLNYICILIVLIKALCYFFIDHPSAYFYYINNSAFLDYYMIYKFKNFAPYIFSLLFLFSCLSLLASLCRNFNDLYNTVFVMIMGIASVVAIGLSPTVYASTERILFIFNLAIIYIVIYLFFNFIKKPIENSFFKGDADRSKI